jgi:lipopolysaccharide transport protein LptA
MHIAVRTLRFVIPILFLTFLGLIFLNYSRRPSARPEEDRFEPNLRKNDKPRLVATAFEDTQSVGGRVVSRIRAGRTVGFASGWYTLEGVELTIFRPNGQSYQLVCPTAQFRPDTKEAEASGGVIVRSSDGVELATESMTFNGTKLTNRVPLRFRMDSWSGRAGGVDFDVSQETMLFSEPIEATQQEPGKPASDFLAKSGTFFRERGEIQFAGGVTMNRANDSIATDSLAARFDRKLTTLTGLEGVGKVTLNLDRASSLVPAADVATGDRLIRADRFYAEVVEGVIQAMNLHGDTTPAQASFSGPPLRIIDAMKFRIGFDAGKPKDLQLAGVVKISEPAPEKREIFANTMTLLFDPVSGKPSMALADGYFRYFDAKNQAASTKASYDLIHDSMVMLSTPGAAPRLTAGGNQITANRIEASPKAGVLKAIGAVTTRLESGSGGTSAANTGIFPEREGPVFVRSNLAILRQNEKVAVFSGDVRAWQKTNVLFASELSVTGEGETLHAKGGVRGTMSGRRGDAAAAPVLLRADAMFGRKSARKIELTGNVHIEDGARKLDSQTAVIHLGENQKIERIEASEKLVISEPAASRKGEGRHAVYDLTKKTIIVDGSPATLTDPRGSVKGERIVFDLKRNRADVSGAAPVQATYNPQ